ncbi:hypothetical protein J2W95_002917 [Flavobacterium granuli]|uniref:Uncharacterized protein n=1 Tax=Flavobacterium granuli TaxID=280093 RepID=A0ABU1S592_9FLAO|nr:hypothetical protein [Flavobacterium granuli]
MHMICINYCSKNNYQFFYSSVFNEKLSKVGVGDVESFRNNKQWLKNYPTKGLLFKYLDNG